MATSKNDNRTNNDLQITTHKTKDRVTRILLKPGGELRCFGRVSSSCSTSGTHRVTLVTNPAYVIGISLFRSLRFDQLVICLVVVGYAVDHRSLTLFSNHIK